MIEKIKAYIKFMEPDWDDLFLLIGFLSAVPFYAFSWLFMVTSNPDDVPFKLWMIIACGAITTICWSIYFYFQVKKGRIKNSVFTWLFVFFAIISLVSVLVQPKDFSIDMVYRPIGAINNPDFVNGPDYIGIMPGTVVNVTATITPIHRLFFAFASVFITTIFYIIFLVLPQRLKTTNFLILCGICTFIFLFILIGYSYITEYYKYPLFFQNLFNGDFQGIYHVDNQICSFVAQRVPYGVCLMLGVIFALVVHAITKKWYLYLLAAFYYINMIFSYNKTSLALTLLGAFVYIIIRLIETFKEYRKRNTIIFIVFGSIIVTGLGVVGISYVTKGAVLSFIYNILKSFTNDTTMISRSYIWDNTFHLLQDGWWLLGRGFGTYHVMLYPMNLQNGDNVCPSHSSYNAVLGAGGIFSLFGFIALIAYYGYVFYQCFKIDKFKTMKLSIGVFSFLFYTFTEGVNYLLAFFMFPLFVFYHTKRKEMSL